MKTFLLQELQVATISMTQPQANVWIYLLGPIEILKCFESLEKDLVHCIKGDFSSQRSKLKALFFEAWNHWLVNKFYHHYGDQVKRWRNFSVQAVDGSTPI